jgi:hypothetical protein
MPFIGNQPAEKYSAFQKQDFTTSATTSYTLDHPVANQNELALFINFVRQEPTTAYTASGTSLTLTSATSSSDDMYCVFLGKAVQTVNPPNGSVGTAQIADDAVTKDKTSNLMYPGFEAYLSSDQTGLTDSTYTKVEFNTEVFDTDGTYDNATNYRFTPAVTGKYFIYSNVCLQTDGGNELDLGIVAIYKNGTLERHSVLNPQSASMLSANIPVFATINLNTTDYIEIFAYIDRTSGGSRDIKSFSKRTHFGAYRIGD